MDVDEQIMARIIEADGLRYTMHVDGRTFDLEDVEISRSKVPVREPTTRGGVYFTDTTAYKIRATTRDLSILSLLPRIMLGPNTEFVPVEVRTSLPVGDAIRGLSLQSHVSNTVNTKEKVELNMIVDRCPI